MTTSLTMPLSALSIKSENEMLDMSLRLLEPWKRLKSATSNKPMITQSAKFLPILFTGVRPDQLTSMSLRVEERPIGHEN
ncbi:MAG: hypothetical protein VXY90_11785 [Pseudomonadota bacterium]|nr:hypothetical protein [Pseudomonadota bacterium]